MRARSVVELGRRLHQRGYDGAEVDETIARLLGQRLLDDAAFAEQHARRRITSGGLSRYRIVQELARKGVARPLAEHAVDALAADGIDSGEGLHRVARKKWDALVKLDERTRRQRLYAFLARRGFSPDDIRGAMRRLGEELND